MVQQRGSSSTPQWRLRYALAAIVFAVMVATSAVVWDFVEVPASTPDTTTAQQQQEVPSVELPPAADPWAAAIHEMRERSEQSPQPLPVSYEEHFEDPVTNPVELLNRDQDAVPQPQIRARDDGSGSTRVAVVIDDLGYHAAVSQAIARLPADITLAVLPDAPFARRVVEVGRASGKELILHQPMEPLGYPRIHPGPLSLFSGMSDEQIDRVLRANLAKFPEVVGINNHMGSRLTAQQNPMNSVMRILRSRGLFFLDSRTSNATVAWKEAQQMQVPNAVRDVFLDNQQDQDLILQQLRLLERVARKQGGAVAIGHPYAATLAALQIWLPETKERRVEVVRVSQFLGPVTARQHYLPKAAVVAQQR
ncbi:MAG: divergent polysaccharide deacetylase family protein [Magnetococcales bacterium]|nr:divergent polysaccharide deacetylase family protein [Magnetococcales bacterium]